MTLIFSDGYESGNFNAWNSTGGEGDSTVENLHPFRGTYNAKHQVIGAGEHGAAAYKNLTAAAIIYMRSYLMFDDDLPAAEGDYFMFNLIQAATIANKLQGVVKYTGGCRYWGLKVDIESVATWTYETSPSNPQTDVYYCVELVRDVTNDYARMYVDGALVVSYDGHSQTANTVIAYVGIVDMGYLPATALTVYADEAVIANSYIGLARNTLAKITKPVGVQV